MRRYDIIEKMEPGTISWTTVELPSDFFKEHLLEGYSVAGNIDEIINDIRTDEYFRDDTLACEEEIEHEAIYINFYQYSVPSIEHSISLKKLIHTVNLPKPIKFGMIEYALDTFEKSMFGEAKIREAVKDNIRKAWNQYWNCYWDVHSDSDYFRFTASALSTQDFVELEISSVPGVPRTVENSSKEMLLTDDVEALLAFYEVYDSCWDYTHQMLDRGLMLSYFINSEHPEYTWMFVKPFPVHLCDIPEAIQPAYIDYLKKALAELWGVPVDTLIYNDLIAAREYEEQGE